jgi:hypothetical protein
VEDERDNSAEEHNADGSSFATEAMEGPAGTLTQLHPTASHRGSRWQRSLAATKRICAPWLHGDTVWSIITVITSGLFLPGWPLFNLFVSSIVSPFTTYWSNHTDLSVADVSQAAIDWTLSGLLINFTTILFAIIAVIRQNKSSRFETVFQVWFGIIGAASLVIAAAVHWTAPYVIWMVIVFSGLYVVNDSIGAIYYRRVARHRTVYLFPLVCLDGPALFASLVIYATTADSEFLHGMAAGHLTFAAVAYIGIVAIMLPWVVYTLCPQIDDEGGSNAHQAA